MKTPQELQRIFDRLPKEKVELGVHKIELGIIDEIQESLKSGKAGSQKANRIKENITSLYTKLSNVVDDIDNMKTQLSNVGDAENGLGLAIQIYNKVIPQSEQQAKALGVSPKEIKGYSELKKLFGTWEKSLKALKGSEKAGRNILSQIR
tara:strand:- start:60 stop:509 length:450 start_codon:yes stop_codon:yes gene_type:complete